MAFRMITFGEASLDRKVRSAFLGSDKGSHQGPVAELPISKLLLDNDGEAFLSNKCLCAQGDSDGMHGPLNYTVFFY